MTQSGTLSLADSLLQQMFVVRFLGSMAVKTDSTAEVIYEAMRQVLAARAIHNIFRMTESHLVVTSQALRYVRLHSLHTHCRQGQPSRMPGLGDGLDWIQGCCPKFCPPGQRGQDGSSSLEDER